MAKKHETPPLDLSASFTKRYRRYALRVEEALDAALPPAGGWPDAVHEALRYCVFSGGKRLRPVLVLAACDLLGGDLDRALIPACAIEFVHTYSLVHDDLPCMDNDRFRRGRPTAHVVYGEALAVLAGDALLTRAFECLSDPSWPVIPMTAAAVIGELARAAGTSGLIAGQVADLEAAGVTGPGAPRDAGGPAPAARELERIHRHKTGALFRAAVRMGALVAGAPPEALNDLTEFAEHFGLAFQITDDLLDVTGDERETGRPSGSDERQGKFTFVSLYGIAGSQRHARESAARAIDALRAFGHDASFLRDLAAFAVLRSG